LTLNTGKEDAAAGRKSPVNVENGSDWKKFVGKHWRIFALFAVAAVLVFVWAIYVFVWFLNNAQSSGLLPSGLSLWTLGSIVTLVLHTIFWELLLVGIPVAVVGAIGWRWWARLPAEKWSGYHWGKRTRNTGGGGGGGLFFFILFCIKVYADGNWNVPISTWTVNYVVGSMILILALLAAIVGIPGAIVGIWWVRREMKKP
jgi:hypothetical protein